MALQAKAADFCIDTSEGFQLALDVASSNQESNHIMLVQGLYRATESGVPNTGFKWFHSDVQPLVISGGWLKIQDQCVAPDVPVDPRETVINGGFFDRGFEVVVGQQEINLTITNLEIRFGSSPPPINGFLTRGAGMKIASASQSQFAGSILLDRILLQDNNGVNAAALYVEGAEHVVVRNSVFLSNRPSHYGTSLITVPDGGRAYFVNNVFRGNHVLNLVNDPHAAAEFHAEPNSQTLIANNLFWANDNFSDVLLTGDAFAERWLVNNLVFYVNGVRPTVDVGNFASQVIEISNDWIPHVDSEYINAAFSPDPNLTHLFEHAWQPGPMDIMGNIRVYGGGLDIGPGEETELLVFKNNFD